MLIGKAAVIPVNFDPPAKRRSDDQIKLQYSPDRAPGSGRGGGGGGRGNSATPS